MKICTLLQFHFSDLHENFDKNNMSEQKQSDKVPNSESISSAEE